jgi:hypothetical protein
MRAVNERGFARSDALRGSGGQSCGIPRRQRKVSRVTGEFGRVIAGGVGCDVGVEGNVSFGGALI